MESLLFEDNSKFLKFISKNKSIKKTINDIINSGIDINQLDVEKRSALHMACLYKNEQGISNLLLRGADVNLIDSHGYTAFLYAVIGCSTKSISELLNFGSDINFISKDGKYLNALSICIFNNNKVLLNFLLLKGADPNITISKNRNLLIYACNKSNEHCALKILKYIKNINHIDTTKSNAAHYAVDFCSSNLLEELINKKINMYQRDNDNETPIHTCIKNNKIKSFNIILSKLNINDLKSLNYNDSNLLHYAAYNDADQFIDLLVSKGFKVNTLNKMKESALSLAIRYNKIKAIRKLLELNACTLKGSYKNDNPIFVSTYRGYEIFNMITEGYDLDTLKNMGKKDNIIHSTCYHNNYSLLKKLIEMKFDINQKNELNFYPIELCFIFESFDCIKILVECQNLNFNLKNKSLILCLSWIRIQMENNFRRNKIDLILNFLISLKKINSSIKEFDEVLKKIYEKINNIFNDMRNNKDYTFSDNILNIECKNGNKCFNLCECCNALTSLD